MAGEAEGTHAVRLLCVRSDTFPAKSVTGEIITSPYQRPTVLSVLLGFMAIVCTYMLYWSPAVAQQLGGLPQPFFFWRIGLPCVLSLIFALLGVMLSACLILAGLLADVLGHIARKVKLGRA